MCMKVEYLPLSRYVLVAIQPLTTCSPLFTLKLLKESWDIS